MSTKIQICPEMQVNKMQAPYDKHHKVSSSPKSHQNKYNSVKYEVIWKWHFVMLIHKVHWISLTCISGHKCKNNAWRWIKTNTRVWFAGAVCVACISGPLRKGKSFALSEVFNQPNVFRLGHEMKAETIGIWLWIVPETYKVRESTSTHSFGANTFFICFTALI